MADLKIGDVFDTEGYDVVFVCPTYEGDQRYEVLCNNSSHYIVIHRDITHDDPNSLDGWSQTARLVDSFSYILPPDTAVPDKADEFAFRAWAAACGVAYLVAKRVSEIEAGIDREVH